LALDNVYEKPVLDAHGNAELDPVTKQPKKTIIFKNSNAILVGPNNEKIKVILNTEKDERISIKSIPIEGEE
jgi:hypothetical protein